jgi:hypothetical protein
MITKYEDYWHLYFREECEDTPQAILEVVQKLFKEISEMGDIHFMRCNPEIEKHNLFEGGIKVVVFCRFSSIAPRPIEEIDGPSLFGLAPQ